MAIFLKIVLIAALALVVAYIALPAIFCPEWVNRMPQVIHGNDSPSYHFSLPDFLLDHGFCPNTEVAW